MAETLLVLTVGVHISVALLSGALWALAPGLIRKRNRGMYATGFTILMLGGVIVGIGWAQGPLRGAVTTMGAGLSGRRANAFSV